MNKVVNAISNNTIDNVKDVKITAKTFFLL